MGKVRKLRKKYETFCRKNAAINKQTNSKKKLKISASPVKENSYYNVGSIGSTISSLRTNNESAHRKPQHLISAIRPVQGVRFSEKATKALKLHDNLPVIKKYIGQKNNGSRKMKMKGKTDPSRKQITKIRQSDFVQDIYVFKKTLNEESFLKNPQTVVMNQTLKRLSTECSFYSKN